MQYGTLKNGKLTLAPNPLIISGNMIYNPPEEMYIEHGYLPVERTGQPDQDKFYTATWEESDGKIVIVWTEAEPPEIENETEAKARAYDIITGVSG